MIAGTHVSVASDAERLLEMLCTAKHPLTYQNLINAFAQRERDIDEANMRKIVSKARNALRVAFDNMTKSDPFTKKPGEMHAHFTLDRNWLAEL